MFLSLLLYLSVEMHESKVPFVKSPLHMYYYLSTCDIDDVEAEDNGDWQTKGEKQFGAKHIGNWCLFPKLPPPLGGVGHPSMGYGGQCSLSWPLWCQCQCSETIVDGRDKEEVGAEVSVSSY